MKKYITIAALLAAGSACANAELDLSAAACNTALSQALTSTAYKLGDAFELKFNIASLHSKDASGIVLNLTSNWGIFTQQGKYIGVDNKNTDDRTWVSPTSSDLENGIFTWVTNETTSATLLDSWVSKSSTGGNVNPGLDSVIISFDGADTTVTLGMKNGTTSIIQANGYILDAQGISFGVQGVNTSFAGNEQAQPSAGEGVITLAQIGTFKANGIVAAIPEPSTFGLLAGLGALALVGTRRRRR